MSTINRRSFLNRIGLTTGGLLILQSGCALNPPAKSSPGRVSGTSLGDKVADEFASPPFDCGPWVYWFWLDVNVTREGITADLEAMKAVGICGVLIMDVDQGTPPSFNGSRFGDAKWYDLFQFACQEANRLGIEVNMTNDAGWCGSGGPWITPELSMQVVVWSSTPVVGGKKIGTALPQPSAKMEFYRDIAVLAFPTPAADLTGQGYRIPNASGLSDSIHGLYNALSQTQWENLPADQLVLKSGILDVTEKMDKQGVLQGELPDGNWTVLRFGHTTTGVNNHPAPVGGLGLETDKLSRQATLFQFEALMGKIIQNIGPLAGQTLVATHIDSWETGAQNWTPTMREDFKRRHGYDLLPYLPVLTGRVVDSLEISQRFLWDLRKTIGDLLVENYAGAMREIARKYGLRLSIEGYFGEPASDVAYGGQAVEPMSECWSWDRFGERGSVTEMVSAGHVYGRNIIGQETFTANSQEKWLGHPAVVKDIGDWTFCEGVNRFVFHRYAMQPWTDPHCAPGMSMGPWGLHYERTQTWWNMSKPWHDYVARCCYMLRQGHFVADVCYMEAEGAPWKFSPPTSGPQGTSVPPNYPFPPQNGPGSASRRPGYNYDGCPPELVLERMEFEDGFLTLPGGMKYRVLALPDSPTMTLELLEKIKKLVDAGALVIGPKPGKSPGLANFPRCDDRIQKLAAELWDGGKITSGTTPAEVLSARGIKPDFECDQAMVRWIHRRSDDMDIYFVANGAVAGQYPYGGWPVVANCSFRITGIAPEVWDPETGRISPIALYDTSDGMTRVSLVLPAKASVFVVFRRDQTPASAQMIRSITRNGKTVLLVGGRPAQPRVRILSAVYGTEGAPSRVRDARADIQKLIASGNTSFPVVRIAEIGGDPALNVVKTLDIRCRVNGQDRHLVYHDGDTVDLNVPGSNSQAQPQIEILSAVYGEPAEPPRMRDARADIQKLVEGGNLNFPVVAVAEMGGDPAENAAKTLDIRCLINGQEKHLVFHDGDIVDFEIAGEEPPATVETAGDGTVQLCATKPGDYQCALASGKTAVLSIPDVPEPVQVPGPWTVTFPEGWGAPAQIRLKKLVPLNQHSEAGVRHFSGTASYHCYFDFPAELLAADYRIELDLGDVAVMASVMLNGQPLGILWKSPFQVDATAALRPGRNTLEIAVANLWVNRLIGDQHLPPDPERNQRGTLARWPQWLLDGKPTPTGRFAFTTWELWKKSDPLIESGLIGPVRLRTTVRKTVQA